MAALAVGAAGALVAVACIPDLPSATSPVNDASVDASTDADAAKAGFDDSFIYRELQLPHLHRKIPMIQLMREESLAAFRAWEQKSDKTSY